MISKNHCTQNINIQPYDIIKDLDQNPFPIHKFCNYRKYISKGGFVSIQTKRGCPYNCIYCIYPLLEGSDYRLRSAEMVVDEIEMVVKENQANTFFFTDSVFNTPYKHAADICKTIIKRNLKIRWMAYCNPIELDVDIAQNMVESGCVGIEFGIDSAIPKMIEKMGKPFTQNDIKNSLQAAYDCKLPFAIHLLFGGPSETKQDIEETQKFLDTCAAANAIFASLGIRIYDNTPLKKIAINEGIIYEKDELFEPIFYLSKQLGNNPIEFLDNVARKRAEWSTQVDWMKTILKITQKVINHIGLRPQWRDVRNYGKYMRR